MGNAGRARVSEKKASPWLPEVDRILLVGIKHGPPGIREATKKVIALRAGLTRADCWKRLRILKQKNIGDYPAPRNWPSQIKDLLREGYKEGGKKKRQAIQAIRTLYPGLPSHCLSRFARRQGWFPKNAPPRTTRPWTECEDRKLWELAGYEPAHKIAERLGRTEGAIRFRLKALGLSVKVKDGWSFRALQAMLHVGPSKLRRFIADGTLRVRDPRISATSLTALFARRAAADSTSKNPSIETLGLTVQKGTTPYSWGKAAKLLGTCIDQVRTWVAKGELKIVDGFVTERAFQDFCKVHASELNGYLLGEEVIDWLADGYGLQVLPPKEPTSVPSTQKHALITRMCPKCRKPMRGNIFFRHIKNCKGLAVGNVFEFARYDFPR